MPMPELHTAPALSRFASFLLTVFQTVKTMNHQYNPTLSIQPQQHYQYHPLHTINTTTTTLSIFTNCLNGRGVRGDRYNFPIQVISFLVASPTQ